MVIDQNLRCSLTSPLAHVYPGKIQTRIVARPAVTAEAVAVEEKAATAE